MLPSGDQAAAKPVEKSQKASRGVRGRLFERALAGLRNIPWKSTKFFGSKSVYPDGTYVSTEWFALLAIPLVPLRTRRVMYHGTSHGWRRKSSEYLVIQKLRLDLRQVLKTYSYILPPLALAILLTVLAIWLVPGLWVFPAALAGFWLPVLVACAFYFLSKPPLISDRPRPLSTEQNIARVVQPDDPAPATIAKPDKTKLEPLIEKLKPILKWYVNHPDAKTPEWLPVKNSLDDVILLNYETILPFMEKVVYRGSGEIRTRFEEQVKGYTSMASSVAWMLGKEWAEKNPALRGSLSHKETVWITDIPAAELEILRQAVYFPYFLFAYVFNGYYGSKYGKDSRYQKSRHLADTYQGMLKAVMICFLMGLGTDFSIDVHEAVKAARTANTRNDRVHGSPKPEQKPAAAAKPAATRPSLKSLLKPAADVKPAVIPQAPAVKPVETNPPVYLRSAAARKAALLKTKPADLTDPAISTLAALAGVKPEPSEPTPPVTSEPQPFPFVTSGRDDQPSAPVDPLNSPSVDRFGTKDAPASPLNAYSGDAKLEKEVEAYESPFRYHFNRNKLPQGAKLGQVLTPINQAGSPEANPFESEPDPAAPAFDYTENDAREFLQPLATSASSGSTLRPIRRVRSARSSAALAAIGRVLSSLILVGVSAVVLFVVAYLSMLWAPKLPKIDLGAIPFVAAANPTATPSRTAYPTLPATPTVTVQPCTLWSDLKPTDVGSVKCVYGTIVKIYHTEVMFEIIRFSDKAGTFLVWDKKAYFEGIDKGMCVKVEGMIYKDASELYMEIAGSTWEPYTGCP